MDLSFLTDPSNPVLQKLVGDYVASQMGGGAPAQQQPYNEGQLTQIAQASRPILLDSPEWKAFLNALGLEKSTFAADVARREGVARQAAQFQTEGLVPQYDAQRRSIAGNAESRGVVRSGEYLRHQAESKASQGRANTGIQLALQSQIGDLEGALAQKNAALESQTQQQRASMLAAGYQSGTAADAAKASGLDFGALDRYMKARAAGAFG